MSQSNQGFVAIFVAVCILKQGGLLQQKSGYKLNLLA